ncbi:MAG TPA: hypothetical protein VJ729_17425 [Nitrososphaeraceae archaeon]|nr:hypothetical protein [Nitrososphaeraceae archaeon]
MDKKIHTQVRLVLPISATILLAVTATTFSSITDFNAFAAKSGGAFSPTGYCAPGGQSCIPCDPGVSPYCIPSSNWPGGGFASNTNHGSKTNPPLNNNNNLPTSSQSAP